jgi:tetratricopeptide (TPR) repeat protein
MGLVYGDVPLSQWLSEARLAAGDAIAALPLAIEALEIARTRRYRGQEGWTLRLLGEIAAQDQSGNVERGEAYYRQAIALAEELEMRPLEAQCHMGLGTLLARISRSEEARGQLSIAASMLREMDMQAWIEKTESALKQF